MQKRDGPTVYKTRIIESFPAWRPNVTTPSASATNILCSQVKKTKVTDPPTPRIKCGKIEDLASPKRYEDTVKEKPKHRMAARINRDIQKENQKPVNDPGMRRTKSARSGGQGNKSMKELRQEAGVCSANENKEKREACQEHFNHWLQEKLKQENEMKKKKKTEEREVDRIKREKENVRCQLNELMKEEWLRRKDAEKKEELEKKKKEQEVVETEKKMKEIISKIKVNKWMEKAQKKPGPVDQNIFSLQKTHISFYNPDPWKSIIEE